MPFGAKGPTLAMSMEECMGRLVTVVAACVMVSASLYGQDARRDAAREMDRILGEMSQKRHEREMQRRQQEHERRMAELAAAQQANAAKPVVPEPRAVPAPADPLLAALGDPANYTQSMPNGHIWSALDPFLRTFYLSAATDGVRSVRGKSPFEGSAYSYDDAIAAVSAFYEETGRKSIPITYVVKLVALKATNAPNLKAETQAVLKQFSTWDVSD
jgi:hypothetical protein